MKRALILGAMAAAVVAIPASPALANHGSNCGYTSTQTSTGDLDPGTGELVVYAGSGMSGGATAAAGACLNTNTVGVADFEGGTGEAGAGFSSDGLPGAYAIVDGDNDNTDPGSLGPADSQSDGYIGVSNFETGPRSDPVTEAQQCIAAGPDQPANNGGTNSGGCVGPDGGPYAPVPLVACGNTSGNTWDATTRDGCSLP